MQKKIDSESIQTKFSQEELYDYSKQKPFEGKYINQISFPLGGIGAGCIGLSGRGSLRDFEIFNRPNMGSKAPKTFSLMRVAFPKEKREPLTRVLEGPIKRPYTPHDGGSYHANAEGFPHMDSVSFRGEYPFAWLDFKCKKIPAKISLEAYNPFVPSDSDASGFPIAQLKYAVTNHHTQPIEVSILWSLLNMVGFTPEVFLKLKLYGRDPQIHGDFSNEYKETNDQNVQLRGLYFTNQSLSKSGPFYGSMSLSTPEAGDSVTYARWWKQSLWFSSHYHVWESFKETGKAIETEIRPINRPEAGRLCVKKTINPGKTRNFTFYISWHFPNFYKYWEGWNQDQSEDVSKKAHWKNYYSTKYKNAWDVVEKFGARSETLYQLTKTYHDALFGSSIPNYALDAIASNASILKTPTAVRLEDGTFYGWEGCFWDKGCCEGSCTHVWGYQQALPFLFPDLERSMEEANYDYNFVYEEIGAMEFRLQLPLGSPHSSKIPCADGQLGGIMHLYREWKVSGDDDWLRKLWLKAKKALEFAWLEWDEHKSGVLRGPQHNTYDIEFVGPNSMLTSYYLGALKAGEEIAAYLGDEETAKEYKKIREKGTRWVKKNLFNGEFYIQKLPKGKSEVNQVLNGCLIDQVLGDQLARLAGLGRILPKDQVVSALKSIFRYNWKQNVKEHENGARLYAVNEEAATVLCTWPKGNRPEIPFPYADEVMNGFEYQFATHCILEGLLEEGLTAIKSIRDRYDGWGRNPWNEFECGHHYARSMASHGILLALSGFSYDKGQGKIGFEPRLRKENFETFWSLDGAWGTFAQKMEKDNFEADISILYGNIRLKRIFLADLNLKKGDLCPRVLDFEGKEVDCKIGEGGEIILSHTIHLHNDQTLAIITIPI